MSDSMWIGCCAWLALMIGLLPGQASACEGLAARLEAFLLQKGLAPAVLHDEVHALADRQPNLTCARLALEGGANVMLVGADPTPDAQALLYGQKLKVSTEEGSLEPVRVRLAAELLEKALQLQPDPQTALKRAIVSTRALVTMPSLGPRDAEAVARLWTWTLYRSVLQNRFDPGPDQVQQRAAMGALRSALMLLSARADVDAVLQLDGPAWSSLVVLVRLAVERYAAIEESDWLAALRGEEGGGAGGGGGGGANASFPPISPSPSDRLLLEEFRGWRHWAWRLPSGPSQQGRQVAAALLARILIWQIFQADVMSRENLEPARQNLPYEVQVLRSIMPEPGELKRDIDQVLERLGSLEGPVLGGADGAPSISYYGLPPALGAPLAAMEAQYRLLSQGTSAKEPVEGSSEGSTESSEPSLTEREWEERLRILHLAIIATRLSLVHEQQAEGTGATQRESAPALSRLNPPLFGWYSAANALDEALRFVGEPFLSADRARKSRWLKQLLPLLLEIPGPQPNKDELLLEAASYYPEPASRTRARTTVLRDATATFYAAQASVPLLLGQLRRYLIASEDLRRDRLDASSPLISTIPRIPEGTLERLKELGSKPVLPVAQGDGSIGEEACLDAGEVLKSLERHLPDPSWEAFRDNLRAFTARAQAEPALCNEPPMPEDVLHPLSSVYPGADLRPDPPVAARLLGLRRWLETVNGLWIDQSGDAGRLGLLYPARLVLDGFMELADQKLPVVLQNEEKSDLQRTLEAASCVLLAAGGPRGASGLDSLLAPLGIGLRSPFLCGAQAAGGRLIPLAITLRDLPRDREELLESASLSVQTRGECVPGEGIDPTRPETWGNAQERPERCTSAAWLTRALRDQLEQLQAGTPRPWRDLPPVEHRASSVPGSGDERPSSLLQWQSRSTPQAREPITLELQLTVSDDPGQYELVWRGRRCAIGPATQVRGWMTIGPQGACDNGRSNQTRATLEGGPLQ